MRLTYRDAIATLLVAGVVAVTLAVTQGWDWPMLGTVKAGIVAAGVLGFAGCAVGTRSQDMANATELKRHPGMIVGSILGAVALGLFVAGVITGTEAWLIAFAAAMVALWALATTRHGLVGSAIARGPQASPAT